MATHQGTKIKTITRFEYIDYTTVRHDICNYDQNYNMWVYENTYYFKNSEPMNWNGDLDVYSIRADVDYFPLDYTPELKSSYRVTCECGIDKVYGEYSGLDHYPYCPKSALNGNQRGQKQ